MLWTGGEHKFCHSMVARIGVAKPVLLDWHFPAAGPRRRGNRYQGMVYRCADLRHAIQHRLHKGERDEEWRQQMLNVSAGPKRALVCVVDDDESVREALPDLLGEFGFEARAFASAEEFLSADPLPAADCLILDVAMPGMTGPELHLELKRRAYPVPVIFITAHTDPALMPRLIEQGAVACLFKPFSDIALRDAVAAALATR